MLGLLGAGPRTAAQLAARWHVPQHRGHQADRRQPRRARPDPRARGRVGPRTPPAAGHPSCSRA